MTSNGASGRRFRLLLSMGCVALLLLHGVARSHAVREPEFKNIDITGATCCRDFSLTDHTGKTRSIKDFHGKVVVLTFGFTHCPDVCPTTLADLGKVMKKLGRDAKRVQVLFVTLDPERDSGEVLAKYVSSFNPGFVGLRGPADVVARTAKDFRVFYKKQSGASDKEYLVDHTLGSYVFDPEGRARVFVSHRKDQQLISDIRSLLAGKPAAAPQKSGA